MGKHSEWRKVAKKARRKRIRRRLAQDRELSEKEAQRKREASPSYQKWLEEQEIAEKFQEEEEARLAADQQAQWLKVEEESKKQWQELQKKLELAREEQERQNTKIRLEWEKEQQRLKELKEQKEKEAEQKRLEQQKLREEIENFVVIGGSTPEHLKIDLETNPGKAACPFFKKTSACRFGDSCSRNHIRPGVSCILLIPNFYSHISLTQTENEHGSDTTLEFESEELYRDFKEFFYDVVPELETYGKVVHFKTCCNHVPHLRGNVYVEFSQTREAVKCYMSLTGRYYGGKQLNVEFCKISFWNSAICGLFFRKRCPKGTSCNFLHVFRNPDKLFPHYKIPNQRIQESSDDRRNWRWSESPERDYHENDEWDAASVKSHRSKQYSSPVHTNGSSRRKTRSRSISRRSSSRRSKSKSPARQSSSRRSRSKSPIRQRSSRRSKLSRSRSKSPRRDKYQSHSQERKRIRSSSRSSPRRKKRTRKR